MGTQLGLIPAPAPRALHPGRGCYEGSLSELEHSRLSRCIVDCWVRADVGCVICSRHSAGRRTRKSLKREESGHDDSQLGLANVFLANQKKRDHHDVTGMDSALDAPGKSASRS